MGIRQLLPLVLIASVTLLSGCTCTKLYLIDKQDIQKMEKGQSLTPDRAGYFISEFYLKEVMDAQVEEIRKTS